MFEPPGEFSHAGCWAKGSGRTESAQHNYDVAQTGGIGRKPEKAGELFEPSGEFSPAGFSAKGGGRPKIAGHNKDVAKSRTSHRHWLRKRISDTFNA